jgi:hypothetical protein
MREQPLEPTNQLPGVEGRRDVRALDWAVASGSFVFVKRRYYHPYRAIVRRFRLQLVENVAAAAVGQAEVEEHGIKRSGLQVLERLSARFRLTRIETSASKANLEDPGYGGVILDDQYFGSLGAIFVAVFSIQISSTHKTLQIQPLS